MGPDFMAVIGAVGLQSSPNPAGGSFDLDNLDWHNFPIEHDASLSRLDKFFGDNSDFNQNTWDGTLSFFKGQTRTTTPSASKARYSNVKKSKATNPTSLYGPMQFILSSGETALYVQTMDSPVTNSAKIPYVRSLFEKEKLPYDLGWRPSAVPITLLSLGEYVLQLSAANPDSFAEGQSKGNVAILVRSALMTESSYPRGFLQEPFGHPGWRRKCLEECDGRNFRRA